MKMVMIRWMVPCIALACLFGFAGPAAAIDPPCDAYPQAKQARCVTIWKELNKERGAHLRHLVDHPPSLIRRQLAGIAPGLG